LSDEKKKSNTPVVPPRFPLCRVSPPVISPSWVFLLGLLPSSHGLVFPPTCSACHFGPPLKCAFSGHCAHSSRVCGLGPPVLLSPKDMGFLVVATRSPNARVFFFPPVRPMGTLRLFLVPRGPLKNAPPPPFFGPQTPNV